MRYLADGAVSSARHSNKAREKGTPPDDGVVWSSGPVTELTCPFWATKPGKSRIKREAELAVVVTTRAERRRGEVRGRKVDAPFPRRSQGLTSAGDIREAASGACLSALKDGDGGRRQTMHASADLLIPTFGIHGRYRKIGKYNH